MLIGLTGRNAAGKGEVARYLQTKSFYYYSLSDVIRDEIRSRRLQPTRDLLIAVGNELRQKHGAKILAERVLARIEDDKHYVIDSIRNPAEVEAFRAAKHFKLIRIEAPQEVRFRRILARRRESDPKTFANRRIVAAPVEGNSEAELGPILHEYCEGCGIALELHEA